MSFLANLLSRKTPSAADPETLYGLIRDQLTIQLATFDRVDNTHGLYLSIGSGLLGVLAAVFALRTKPVGSLGVWVFALTGVFYLTLVASEIWSQRVGRWDLGPDATVVQGDYANGLSEDEIKWKIIETLKASYENNRQVYRNKVNAARLALGALVAESLVLFVGLGLVQSQI